MRLLLERLLTYDCGETVPSQPEVTYTQYVVVKREGVGVIEGYLDNEEEGVDEGVSDEVGVIEGVSDIVGVSERLGVLDGLGVAVIDGVTEGEVEGHIQSALPGAITQRASPRLLTLLIV